MYNKTYYSFIVIKDKNAKLIVIYRVSYNFIFNTCLYSLRIYIKCFKRLHTIEVHIDSRKVKEIANLT